MQLVVDLLVVEAGLALVVEAALFADLQLLVVLSLGFLSVELSGHSMAFVEVLDFLAQVAVVSR